MPLSLSILCITAHPDDEAGAFGGTLAHYAHQGRRCRVHCLTAGGAARNRGDARSTEELKAMRRIELATACARLGVEHEIWDLPDGGLPREDFHAVVGRLVMVLRAERPQLVLTMGPEGSATAHPDHAMAGVFATSAFHWAAHERFFPESGMAPWQAARLFYATAPFQPPEFPKVYLPPTDVTLDVSDFVETKIAAFRDHTTQAPLADRVAAFMRLAGGRERFHFAAGAPGLHRDPDRIGDLFEGLES